MPCPYGCICAIRRHTVHSLLVQQAEYDYEWHRGMTSLLRLLMREAPQVINTNLQNSQHVDAVLHVATRAGATCRYPSRCYMSLPEQVQLLSFATNFSSLECIIMLASNTTESKWTWDLQYVCIQHGILSVVLVWRSVVTLGTQYDSQQPPSFWLTGRRY